MSNIPYYLAKARTGYGKLDPAICSLLRAHRINWTGYGHGELLDGLVKDGLWDSFDQHLMGNCAEHCAEQHNITRKDQDEYCLESYRRAAEAIEVG